MNKPTFVFPCLLLLALAGCYEGAVREAASRLRVGMAKAELNSLFKDVQFLKMQDITVVADEKSDGWSYSFVHAQTCEEVYPSGLFMAPPDGPKTIKAHAYLVRKRRPFANPVYVDFIAVFHDEDNDSVIGWARCRTAGDAGTWPDRF